MKTVGVIVALGLFAICAWQGFRIVSAKSAGGFDFEAASLEERHAWLENQARPMALQLDRSLPKGDGPQPPMAVSETRISAHDRVIEIDIAIGGPFQMIGNPAVAKAQFIQALCPEYAASPLGDNRINVVHTFKDRAKRPILSVGVTPTTCRKHLKS